MKDRTRAIQASKIFKAFEIRRQPLWPSEKGPAFLCIPLLKEYNFDAINHAWSHSGYGQSMSNWDSPEIAWLLCGDQA